MNVYKEYLEQTNRLHDVLKELQKTLRTPCVL